MAKKIKRTAIELNYKPNQIAQSLRKGETKTIGLIVADIANPFFGNLARVIEDEANKRGYTVIFGSSDEDEHKSNLLINTFRNRQVDGFIIVPAENSGEQIKLLMQGKVPVVLTDRYFEDLATNYVLLDNYTAGRDATMQFLEKGYQHIAMIAFQSSLIHMKERIRGYGDVMRENGLEQNIHIKYINFNNMKDDMEGIMAKLVNEKPKTDAVFFATNELAIQGLYRIQDMNLKVPDDLALIGFDGNAAFDFFYSPLTYIEQPIEQLGKEAVRVLVEQIGGCAQPVQIELEHNLVVRKSCG